MLHGFTYSLLMVTRKRLEAIAEQRSDYPPIVPELLTNGVADIPKLSLDDAVAQETRNEHVTLAVDRQKKLASAFREHMTEGQTDQTSNDYRRTFYEEVVREAMKVNFPSFRDFVRMTVFSSL
jgi:hypothetical protein